MTDSFKCPGLEPLQVLDITITIKTYEGNRETFTITTDENHSLIQSNVKKLVEQVARKYGVYPAMGKTFKELCGLDDAY